MKILIIHIASAGEVIFSTPLIRALKTHFENAEVYYLTSVNGHLALAESPYLDKVYSVAKITTTVYTTLRSEKFNLIFDLDNNSASLILSMTLPGKVYRYQKRTFKSLLQDRFKLREKPTSHLVSRYMAVGKSLGLKTDDLRLDAFIPYKDEVPLHWLPDPFQKGFVVFCLQAAYATRRLPLNRMIELCDRINKPVLLLGTSDDAADGEAITSFFERSTTSAGWEEGLVELNKKTIVYNACGKFNFHQMASIVKQAKYVFTFDNDFIPMASAFGKHTFSIWGNTALESGRYPYQTYFSVFENNKLACRPCSNKGYDACPLKHFKCMDDVVFDFFLT